MLILYSLILVLSIFAALMTGFYFGQKCRNNDVPVPILPEVKNALSEVLATMKKEKVLSAEEEREQEKVNHFYD